MSGNFEGTRIILLTLYSLEWRSKITVHSVTGGLVRLHKREFTSQLRRLDLTDDFVGGPVVEELLLSRVSVLIQLLSQFVRDLSDLGFALTTLAACLFCRALYGLESLILGGFLRSDATFHF